MADVSGRQAPDRDHRSEEAIVRRDDLPARAWLGERSTACVTLSRSVYTLKAVLAAAYKFSDRYAVLVDTEGDDRWAVFLVGPEGGELNSVLAAFANELGDQQLRGLLEQEFGDLRTLIVAQAFSEGNLLDPGRDAADDRADPQGTGQRR